MGLSKRHIASTSLYSDNLSDYRDNLLVKHLLQQLAIILRRRLIDPTPLYSDNLSDYKRLFGPAYFIRTTCQTIETAHWSDISLFRHILGLLRGFICPTYHYSDNFLDYRQLFGPTFLYFGQLVRLLKRLIGPTSLYSENLLDYRDGSYV